MIQTHRSLIPKKWIHTQEYYEDDLPVFLRMVFSCLVDADHSDTAGVYGQIPKGEKYTGIAAEASPGGFGDYVKGLQKKEKADAMSSGWRCIEACRNCISKDGIVSHDGPVGSGKTTAVMAFQLRQAIEKGCPPYFCGFTIYKYYYAICGDLQGGTGIAGRKSGRSCGRSTLKS